MAAMALMVLAGACGGSKAAEQDGAKADGEMSASTPSTVEGAGGGGDAKGKASTATTQKGSGSSASKSAGTPSKGGSGGEGGSTPTSEAPKPPTPLEASLGSNCVKAGGKQSLTVKVPPDSSVAYDSYYPDGKSGLREGFYGGNNGKVVDSEDGTWTDTWVIAPNAPAGKVRVAVLAVHMGYEAVDRDLFFDLVPPTGTCP
jgi:hypothetical protein